MKASFIVFFLVYSVFALAVDTTENQLLIKLGLPPIYPVKVAVVDTGLNHPHGVHVLGIIQLLNKEADAQMYSFDPYLHSTQSSINAVNRAVKEGNQVINMSYIGRYKSDNELKALKNANKKGIFMVAAAGNNSLDLDKEVKGYPASYEGLEYKIAVANFEDEKTLSDSSNYGKKSVFIGALGTDIPSKCLDSKDNPCLKTGTSMSAPIITSAISMILQRYPKITVKEVKHILSINSIKNPITLKYTEVGLFDFGRFKRWLNFN